MTGLYVPTAFDNPSAAEVATVIPLGVRRTSDTNPAINNSTTFQADPVLLLLVAANAVYHLESRIKYNTNTTANLKIGWLFPTGLTMDYIVLGQTTSGVFTEQNTDQNGTPAIGGFSQDLSFLMDGIVTVGATPGSLQLRVAQNTANASNTVLRANSYIQLTQIA